MDPKRVVIYGVAMLIDLEALSPPARACAELLKTVKSSDELTKLYTYIVPRREDYIRSRLSTTYRLVEGQTLEQHLEALRSRRSAGYLDRPEIVNFRIPRPGKLERATSFFERLARLITAEGGDPATLTCWKGE